MAKNTSGLITRGYGLAHKIITRGFGAFAEISQALFKKKKLKPIEVFFKYEVRVPISKEKEYNYFGKFNFAGDSEFIYSIKQSISKQKIKQLKVVIPTRKENYFEYVINKNIFKISNQNFKRKVLKQLVALDIDEEEII